MRKRSVFILLLFPLLVNGQESIDSVQLKLANQLYQKAGTIYQTQQDSAILLINQAKVHYKKSKAWETYVGCLNVLTTIYHQRSEFDKYKTAGEIAVREAEKKLLPNHPEYAMALNNQISYYNALGDFENAINRLKTALNIYKKNDVSTLDLALVYSNIGNTFVKKGDYQQAMEYHTQALDLRQDTLTKALKLHQDTLQLNRVAEFQYLFNVSKQSIAWAGFKNKELDHALTYFEESLQDLKGLKGYHAKQKEQRIITALQYIAEIQHLKGNPTLAYRHIQEALQYQNKKDAYRKARSYELLGQIDLEQEKLPTATQNFEKALAIFEQKITPTNLPDYARKLVSLARVKERTGALDEALRYYQKALQVLAPGFKDNYKNPATNTLFSKLDALDILKNKGVILWKKYQTTKDRETLTASYDAFKSGIEVIKAIREGVVTKEAKNILAEKTIPIYEGAIRSVLALHQITGNQTMRAEAFALAESNKSLSLLEAINEQAALGMKGLPDSLIQKEKELRLEIAFYQRQLIEATQIKKVAEAPNIKKYKNKLFELKVELTQLTDYFEEKHPRFHRLKYQQTTSSIKDCQQFLANNNQGLIEYFVGEENIYGFVLWFDGFELFQLDQDPSIDQAIQQLQQSISKPPKGEAFAQNYRDFTSAASLLYQSILAPALQLLPKEIQSLKIIPDDQLNYIPFDLLLMEKAPSDVPYFDTDHLEYVLEKYPISYEYSATLMLKNDNNKPQNYRDDFIAYAPSFQKASTQTSSRSCLGELYDLSCNQKEVKAIHQLLDGNIYLADAALKSGFEAEAANYRIIHMATHACVDEVNPQFNKIFLKDDYLSNADLYNTQLTAELVVLSACNTGSGKLVKGEGVLSLARGFVQAGCASSIVTQWSVDDCTTSKIMVDFYQNLIAGQNKDQALQHAKLKHLASADQISMHPYYWAAFVQSGNAKAMSFSSRLFPMIGFALLFFVALAWFVYKKYA